ncbi:uncharacterized mitochondrial protein AtMg00810-like [Pyrus communis]|uniref:uncharacterized mitochondrial protein AtMg00810-like n=1 Tax=Pyrus communis TaxID=23211 RepID=UPI0035C00066
MQEEFNALQSAGTCALVPSNPSQNLVRCKSVFRIKRKPDGSVDRYKARLVAKGDVISQLSVQFPVKDLGDLHYFLELEVQRSSIGIFIHQSKYVLDLLKRTKMDGAKPYVTPLGSAKLDHTGALLANPAEYRQIVGVLQYLTWTRPDLSFVVNLVYQFMHSPMDQHLQAVKRILRYLKGSFGHGLWFPQVSSSLKLKAFSDADWAGCSWDRRSTGGFCIFLSHSLISWSAKKQHIVTCSSTEAEYRSLAHTAAEITWICQLFTDIGFQLSSLPQI